ncbi:PREDICTED: protein phosphatase 1 regulatory subunit 12A isoform X3 [Papilio xuthus]|uniref:Protein phosphatase 1 regulatory subunit 12A isoform X3 n=1 Tax=Papilio xuthus TaxID=66420 RepID=A0AAJ6ZU78_PAPXU|nr:PREDICTED: protein phosphatase 1 regulatory subunit 12A isoform X3 [Papilio xuthus]
MDTRSSSALFKRAEQLKRWQESDTNKQSPNPRHAAKIQFTTGTVFLAACKAGDKEEILRLLNKGADINTPNVDGLTALHQACIDDNMDMVEFLVSHGADVNRRDNEGWTPLHATASCGIDSIARFLIENGSDVAAVNYDGELPIDLAEIPESMRQLLRQAIESQGIDCDKCRKAESTALLTDARQWAKNGYVEVRDPKTGGTPLHVAAAKGYLEVAKTLLEDCKIDANCIDYEGWTPLHAAALWGQKEVAALLINHGAKLDIKNYSGQTCVEVVDPKISTWLREAAVTARRKLLLGENTRTRAGSLRRVTPNPTDETTSEGFVNGVHNTAANNHVALRRTHSFETDKSFSQRYRNVTEHVKASSCSSIPPMSPQSRLPSSSIEVKRKPTKINSSAGHTNKDVQNSNKEKSDSAATNTSNPRFDASYVTIRRNSPESVESNTSESTPSTTTPTKLSPGNIFKNFFKTFVPPVRDDESETQRKAHAKRVRETRRSTQGVTLDEIKSAEQLVKNKNNATPEASTSSASQSQKSDSTVIIEDTDMRGARAAGDVAVACSVALACASAPASATASATAAATIAAHGDRRPSWRLRLDPAYKEDGETTTVKATSTGAPQAAAEATVFVRRTTAPSTSKSLNRTDDKETEKRENEVTECLSLSSDLGSCTISSPATQAAQNVIHRRRRSKRRSTGVGQVDFEDLTNDRGAGGDGDEENGDKNEPSNTEERSEENLDYKKLYEDAMVEVKRLQVQLSISETKLVDSEALVKEYEKRNANMSEIEKREKRAMIRKLSEMEEELKQLQKLKAENERLRAENRALTRVVSKLTNSAK